MHVQERNPQCAGVMMLHVLFCYSLVYGLCTVSLDSNITGAIVQYHGTAHGLARVMYWVKCDQLRLDLCGTVSAHFDGTTPLHGQSRIYHNENEQNRKIWPKLVTATSKALISRLRVYQDLDTI
ncbi:hypothetical protein BaRGS_00010436 [Batillaria attramentaria]|uniref:Secreted protein n=1 Tax=Batillaria attramentaria TaxID=370345 RepID=A0ABD0LFA9_9CAEN